jgi:hypothetical protein
MKTFLSALVFAVVAGMGTNRAFAADDEKYDDNGVTFTYPKDWKLTVDPKKGVTTIKVENKKGALAMVQVYAPDTDPKLISTEVEKSLRKIFEGKIVKETDKPSKRKLLGEERDGQTLEIKVGVGDVTSKMEFYAFKAPSKKATICVTLQSASIDSDAKKMVDMIADSLMESKK